MAVLLATDLRVLVRVSIAFAPVVAPRRELHFIRKETETKPPPI